MTIVVYLYLKAAFDSVDRTALYNALHRKDMPEKFVNPSRTLCPHTSGCLSPFKTISNVGHDCPIRLFSFNLFMDELTEDGLEILQDIFVEFANGEYLCDLSYTDYLVCSFESAKHAQICAGRFLKAVASCAYDLYLQTLKFRFRIECQ